ncbi:MAG: histone deacetylase [Verrucomicrobiota bacterium]
MAVTALFTHPDCLEHETGPAHPERPERLVALVDALENTSLGNAVSWYRPDPADRSWIAATHDPGYIRFIEEASLSALGPVDGGDTPVSQDSYHAAMLASGAALEAVDRVLRGEYRNAFCMVRPPGHHALGAQAMGFCLFNHVAIAARYAQRHYGLERIFILDWDVHHGNGTQDSFYDDGQVGFCSLHQYPFYPGSGATEERGEGAGKGATLNLPLAAGADGHDVLPLFSKQIADAIQAHQPELILISAGFDAHRDDPLGQLNLTEEDFGEMTRILISLADEVCAGRVVSLLEGGYDLDALAKCGRAHVTALANSHPFP